MNRVRISYPIYSDVIVDLDQRKIVAIELDPHFGDAHYAEFINDENETVAEGDYLYPWEDGALTHIDFDHITQPDGSTLLTNRRARIETVEQIHVAQYILNGASAAEWEELEIRWRS